MAAVNNPYEAYQRNQVQTAAPEELTLMLYNGLIKFIRQAKVAIEQKQLEKAHTLILRGQDILTEFMVTLKPEYEISRQLLPLYDFMKRNLIQANLHKDIVKLTEVEELAVELRDTWTQAMKLAKNQSYHHKETL